MNRTDKPIANPIVVLREEFDDWAILFGCVPSLVEKAKWRNLLLT